ncbi:MAG: hypothetical protein M5U14_06930 [Acidimicrobiia bacterium]|nr:hypothetical protein [Acidimicrobiia bacterium]
MELVTVVALLGLVLGFTFQGVVSMQRAAMGADQRVVNIGEARVLMATASKDLRTAVRLVAGTSPFEVADDTEVVFYANLDPVAGPKRVRIYLDGMTQLVEEVTPPDESSVPPEYTYTVGPTRIRFVGRYVANEPGQPIFAYYDVDGNALTGTPLSEEDRLKVRQVQITLSVRKSTSLQVKPTTLVNRVRLPNVDYTAVMEQ